MGGGMKPKYSLENLNVSVFLGLLGMHILAIPAFYFWSWAAVWLCLGLTIFTLWIGNVLCYHRLLTHKSFKTPRWFMYTLTVIGNLNFQGGPFFWVGKHRVHHKYSDKPGDPHSPALDGFTWAHVFWLIFRKEDGHDPFMFVRDLVKDRGLVLLDKFSWVPQILLSILLFFLGSHYGGIGEGIAWIVWGVGVRTVVVYHITWFVNSACHTWGYQNFQTRDRSRNLWWVALLSGGEGWHSNHHAEPASASHGMRWFEVDPTYRIIVMLSWFGLTYDIVKPTTWRKRAIVD